MMRKRLLIGVLAIVGLLTFPGCQPQEAPQSLCGDLPGAWFAEATGRTDLKSSVEVRDGGAKTLPFRWDAQHPFVLSKIKCRVMDGDDELAEFQAQLLWFDNVDYIRSAVAKVPTDRQFKAAGGLGSITIYQTSDPLVDSYWYCGSSVLGLTLKKFASDDKAGLTRQLTERIAERVGCTQPYTPPTPTPSN